MLSTGGLGDWDPATGRRGCTGGAGEEGSRPLLALNRGLRHHRQRLLLQRKWPLMLREPSG